MKKVVIKVHANEQDVKAPELQEAAEAGEVAMNKEINSRGKEVIFYGKR
jgi:hypothetical protein